MKVHYRSHKSPSPVPFREPDQSSPCPLSQLLKIHFILSSHLGLGSSNWSLSLRFPHQNPVCNFPQSQTSHMPRPSQSCLFVHPHLIWRGVQIIKFFIMCLLQSPVTSSYLDTNIFLSTLFSNILSLCSSLNISVQVSHPYKILLLLLLLSSSSLLYHNKRDVRSSAQNNLPDAIHSSLSACFIDFLTRETVNFVTCRNGLTSDKVNFTCTFVTIMNTLSGMGKDGRMEKAFHH